MNKIYNFLKKISFVENNYESLIYNEKRSQLLKSLIIILLIPILLVFYPVLILSHIFLLLMEAKRHRDKKLEIKKWIRDYEISVKLEIQKRGSLEFRNIKKDLTIESITEYTSRYYLSLDHVVYIILTDLVIKYDTYYTISGNLQCKSHARRSLFDLYHILLSIYDRNLTFESFLISITKKVNNKVINTSFCSEVEKYVHYMSDISNHRNLHSRLENSEKITYLDLINYFKHENKY